MVKKNKLLIFSILIFTILLGGIYAITFQNIFPTTSPYVTSDSTVNLSYGIHAGDGLSSITHSWNGTNTTLYDSSLVLFMNFDNRSELGEYTNGSTEATCGFVRDLSMYGNNGTVIGCNSTAGFVQENISLVTGKYGNAFNFNGKDKSYIVNASNLNSFNFSSNLTMSFWFKYRNTTQAILDLRTDNGKSMWVEFSSGSFGRLGLLESTGSSEIKCKIGSSADNSFYPEIWYHAVFVVSPNSIKIYANGTECSGYSGTPNYTVFNQYLYTINRFRISGVSYYFNGSIDDLMIWNRSLSASEIFELHSTQVTKYNGSYFESNLTKNTNGFLLDSFLCSKNNTMDSFCTSTNTVKTSEEIKCNFSNSLGTIGNNFYTISGNFNRITGLYPVSSLYEREKTALLNLNANMWRVDMRLKDISLSEGVFNTTGTWGVDTAREYVRIAHENNITVLAIANSMPNWLADKTSGYCNLTTQQNYTCNPSNYSKWGELIVDWIDYVSNNGEYDNIQIEVWNEPYWVTSWLNNLSLTNTTRDNEFIKLYNNTWNYVKAYDSNIKVGGSALQDIVDTQLNNAFFNAFANQSDFFSFHKYNSLSGISTAITYFNNLSSFYNSNCSKLYLSEWNIQNDTILNSSSLWTMNGGDVFIGVLNKINLNLSSFTIHDWSAPSIPITDYYNYYLYEQFTPKQFASYNVTKNFAHLCPAGASVYVTSNDDDTIKQVSCKKGNMYSLIVINTDTNAKNVTANLSLTNGSVFYPYTSIMNYETGSSIPVTSGGIIQLGVIGEYEVLYLTSGDEDGADLRGVFKLNEGSGNTIYDSLQNLSNGLKNGATWINDSIFKTLTSTIDYTISTSGLLVVSSSYLFNYMNASWSYLATWRDTGSTASLVMVDSLGNSTTFLSILIVISFAVVILTLFKPSVNTNPLGKPHY